MVAELAHTPTYCPSYASIIGCARIDRSGSRKPGKMGRHTSRGAGGRLP